MVNSIGSLKKLNNNSVLIHDELTSIKKAVEEGLKEVVESNLKLSPSHHDPIKNFREWKRVEPYKESEWRPLVKDSVESALLNVKKLDIM